ncbi:MAG TPA: SDR family oxidoreductase [Geminicoccaceae bacterium]|nr:SDR family oxidoreductase [Geminicoccaceae bacterium]
MPGVAGKRVLVTAGGAGIGRAIAAAFLSGGARVWIGDIDAEALAGIKDAHRELGGSRTDVADVGAVDAMFVAIEETFGGLDVLVNNAGIAGPTGPIEALDPAEWRRCMAVNLDGAFLCARRAVPLLKAADGGAIINIASTAGLMGYPLRTPYASAKWAVIGLTRSLAIELGPFGIRVNAICPGSVEGARMARVIEAEAAARRVSADEIRRSYVRTTSMRSFVRPEDIAAMALFLCSDLGASISGQAIAVDGNTETLSG